MKVLDVHEAAKFAKDYALRKGPIILEMVTYRYYGHSMSDPGTSYRTREEVKLVQTKQDPINWLTKQIIDNGLKTQAEIEVKLSIISSLFSSKTFLPFLPFLLIFIVFLMNTF